AVSRHLAFPANHAGLFPAEGPRTFKAIVHIKKQYCLFGCFRWPSSSFFIYACAKSKGVEWPTLQTRQERAFPNSKGVLLYRMVAV
ncbi:hypothetical protein, partial [Desulfovibrio sp. ZJ200]|uniref:hypothetical protein n=1 Tax=Desulfovibrio sp. ZJ200 TaxID=2709792 RepID=UPI00197F7E8F